MQSKTTATEYKRKTATARQGKQKNVQIQNIQPQNTNIQQMNIYLRKDNIHLFSIIYTRKTFNHTVYIVKSGKHKSVTWYKVTYDNLQPGVHRNTHARKTCNQEY